MTMNQEVVIAKAVLDHLNQWPDKPCNIRLETMDKAPLYFSMSMQQLTGTKILKKYITGSYIGIWPFAVYVRISGADTSKRIDANRLLGCLADWLESIDPPALGEKCVAEKIEMTGIPAVAATYDDGGVDYQAIFNLRYKHQ